MKYSDDTSQWHHIIIAAIRYYLWCIRVALAEKRVGIFFITAPWISYPKQRQILSKVYSSNSHCSLQWVFNNLILSLVLYLEMEMLNIKYMDVIK